MSQELAIYPEGSYGAPELKKSYQKYLRWALIVAVLFHLFGIGAYWLTIYLQQEDEPTVMVRIMKYSELGPPPSITDNTQAPAMAVSGPAVKPTIGVPVPVPDAEISPEQTIATQAEMAAVPGATGDGVGGGRIEKDIKIDSDVQKDLDLGGPPPDFVAYEDPPQAVKQVNPKYPDIAQRAGLEGTVIVAVWVDKTGKTRKAKVLKSDADIFNQAAMDAAMQWVFTPALQQKKPIDVWVSIPFKFRLQDAAR